MRTITILLCSSVFALGVPIAASAQVCSFLSWTETNSNPGGTCSGTNPNQGITISKTFNVQTKTKCQEQNWKIRDQESDSLYVQARGEWECDERHTTGLFCRD
jgi:hypothetical protein